MKRIFAIVMLVLLTFAYLYPGSAALLTGADFEVMSDDTDIVPLPLSYGNYWRVFQEHPSRLFYGAVYVDHTDPDQGAPSWVSWSERWLALAVHPLVPIEQTSTALVCIYLILDALAMFALAKTLGWGDPLAYGAALAWTFSFYNLARAQVHPAFTGVFHIPLLFLSLLLVARAKTLGNLILPAVLLLLAATASHYYIITAAFLSPLLLVFFVLQPEVRARTWQSVLRLALATLPCVLFLGLNFAFPVPAEIKAKLTSVIPETGAVPDGMAFHPFLTYYAARPVDYFTGPLWPNSFDPNPLRAKLDFGVQSLIFRDGTFGNSHERTNGVRWVVWLLALTALVSVPSSLARRRLTVPEKESARMIGYFALLAAAAFLLSLAPPQAFPRMSPAYWLNALVSQIRVPSRAGLYVGFSLIMIMGIWLNSSLALPRLRKILLLPAVLPLLILADFPPFVTRVQMAPVRPRIESLSVAHGGCGAGIYFPEIDNTQGVLDYYNFQQRMRGTDCQILNAISRPQHARWLESRFPPTERYVKQLPTDETSRIELLRLARCVPLGWIVFDSHVPAPWREGVCRDLGWQLNADLSCVAPDHSTPLQRFPDDCG